MEIIDNIPVWGAPVDDGALKRIKTCCYIFGHAAMMADHHIAGRDWVCDRVVKILGARVLDSVHNHHNFAWRETHGGKDLWVVRKGATPAFPGQRGFVGGTMGETSVILEGIKNEQASLLLYSTIHGAGRVMGRMEAEKAQVS